MALQTNKRIIELGKLYEVTSLGDAYISPNLSTSIWVNAGAVDMYGSDSFTQPIALSEMTLDVKDTQITGKTPIKALTTYIALVQNGSTAPTEVTLTGLEVVDKGSIS